MRYLLRTLLYHRHGKLIAALGLALAVLAAAALSQEARAQVIGSVTLTEVKAVTGTPANQAPLSTQFQVLTNCAVSGGSNVPIHMTFSYSGGTWPWGIFNNGLQVPALCTTTEVLPPPFVNAAGQTCTWQQPTYSLPNPLQLTAASGHQTLTITNNYICGLTHPQGTLKVCKILNGAVQGTPFTFSYTSSAGLGTIPSIPGTVAPGICVVGPTLPAGTTVTVTETGPSGYAVTGVTGTPTPTGTSGSTTHITLVAGVNELTFTNIGTKGYLEICKVGGPAVPIGTPFTFTVGGVPYTVAAGPGPDGYCSPAIQVNAGSVVITETASSHTISMCTMLPSGAPCTFTPTTATVTVNPGGVTDQTIAVITNK